MSEHHRSLDRALLRATASYQMAAASGRQDTTTFRTALAEIHTDPFWQLPPLDLYAEPILPLADRDNTITVPDACAVACAYGGCYSTGYQGCGGCCHCRGGCVVAWENQQTAPFLWNGDPA